MGVAGRTPAVRGVLTSGAKVETYVGPAGTGKTFVVGTIVRAWSDPDLRDVAAGPRDLPRDRPRRRWSLTVGPAKAAPGAVDASPIDGPPLAVRASVGHR